MNMTAIFVIYALVLEIFILLLYFAGGYILKALNINLSNFYVAVFTKITLAVTLVTIISAVCYTNGVTVMIVILPILFVLYLINKGKQTNKQITENTFPGITILISLFVGVNAVFLLKYYLIYNPDGDLPLAPHGDVVFYSNLTDFLMKFGNENSSLDYIYPAGCSPYHYFELWLTALLKQLTGLNTGLLLVLITYSFGPILIWLGLCAVLSQFKKISVPDIFFCLSGVFLTGICFDFYTKVGFMQNIGVFTYNSINYNKLFPVYIYVISALLFFLNKKNTSAVLCLLILPVVFISTSISLFTALSLWVLIEFIRNKKLDKVSAFMIFFVAASIYLFYKLAPEIHTHVSADFSNTVNKLTDFLFLKTCFNIFVGSTLQFILLFVPFLVLYFINEKTKISDILKNSVLYLIFFVYVFSLIGWALLHENNTTVQVFTNITLVVFNVMAFYILAKVWSKPEKLKWYSFLFLFLFVLNGLKISFTDDGGRLFYYQSNVYLEEIYKESNNLSLRGAFIYTSEDYKATQFGYVSNFSKPGNYLIYSKKTTFPLSISPHNYILSEDKMLAAIERSSLVNTPFWKYVEEQKLNGKFESIEKSQLQFIEEFKINYLICTKDVALSDLLKQKIKKVITDNKTGERFCFLNN